MTPKDIYNVKKYDYCINTFDLIDDLYLQIKTIMEQDRINGTHHTYEICNLIDKRLELSRELRKVIHND